jgi:glycerol kinase
VRWILDQVDGARQRAERGELMFGTVDSWLLWNLTGGWTAASTSPTSRTRRGPCSMDLDARVGPGHLRGDRRSAAMLPEIRSSAEVYGRVRARIALAGVPVASALGDQHAATFGQACFDVGSAKNTYGTGNFLLLNTGNERVRSEHGLITTVCYRIGDAEPVYALEGSIAVTGSLVQWLRDNLGLIRSAPEVEELARTVDDNGGAYIVPAFSGLFAPYWRPDAAASSRADPLRHQGPSRPGGARGHRVPDARGRGRHDGRTPACSSASSRSTAAWWATSCSCSSRRTSSACRWSGRRWRRRPRSARRTRPVSRSATGPAGRPASQLDRGPAMAAPDGRRHARPRAAQLAQGGRPHHATGA